MWSFDSTGAAVSSPALLSLGMSDRLSSILVDPQGFLWVAGVSYWIPDENWLTANYHLSIWKLGQDGTVLAQNYLRPRSGAEGLALDRHARVLAVGEMFDYEPNSWMLLSRWNGDATLDASFGDAGIATYDGAADPAGVSSGWDDGFGVSVDSSDRIVVAGASTNDEESNQLVLWRFTDSGALDLAFGSGKGFVLEPKGTESGGYGVALDPSGWIVVIGWGLQQILVRRFDFEGIRDPNFDESWFTLAAPAGATISDRAIRVDAAGRILLTGSGPELRTVAVWRY